MFLGAVFRLDKAGHDLGFRRNASCRIPISSLPTDIVCISVIGMYQGIVQSWGYRVVIQQRLDLCVHLIHC
jgi:hypothetical protein